MDFANQYIGKPLGQLSYEDVVNYFSTPREETDLIEFKSYHTHAQATFDNQVEVIATGISAFLNSGGGLLIWGGT